MLEKCVPNVRERGLEAIAYFFGKRDNRMKLFSIANRRKPLGGSSDDLEAS